MDPDFHEHLRDSPTSVALSDMGAGDASFSKANHVMENEDTQIERVRMSMASKKSDHKK